MSLTLRRADGSSQRLSGYRFSAEKARKLGARVLRAPADAGQPPRVDLRPYMTAVENQGDTNSCVANAVAGAYEYLFKRHHGDSAYDVSRLFIYYNARTLEDEGEPDDEGSFISDAIEGLKQYGACAESTWPFKDRAVNRCPPDEAYHEAAGFLISTFSKCERSCFRYWSEPAPWNIFATKVAPGFSVFSTVSSASSRK